jgi:hypothetical protein
MAPCHRLLALAVAVSLAACGGSSPSTPTTPPTPRPPQRTLIAQGSQSNIPPAAQASLVFFVVVQTTSTGTLDATVDWTFTSNQVALAWASGNCIQNPNCTALFTNATLDKPKTLSAPNLAAGTYTLVVANLGTTDESVSYQVFFTG